MPQQIYGQRRPFSIDILHRNIYRNKKNKTKGTHCRNEDFKENIRSYIEGSSNEYLLVKERCKIEYVLKWGKGRKMEEEWNDTKKE